MCLCVNIELNFGSDADSQRFPVVAAAPAPISLLEPSVYICVSILCIYSRRFLQVSSGKP